MSDLSLSSGDVVQDTPLAPYVATLRCVIFCHDEVEATITAERLVERCIEYLDEEEGDLVVVTQVSATTTDVNPEETLVILRRARNALIRTRIKQCYDQARELDKTIYALESRDLELSNYDYGRLLDIAEQVLNNKGDPLT